MIKMAVYFSTLIRLSSGKVSKKELKLKFFLYILEWYSNGGLNVGRLNTGLKKVNQMFYFFKSPLNSTRMPKIPI